MPSWFLQTYMRFLALAILVAAPFGIRLHFAALERLERRVINEFSVLDYLKHVFLPIRWYFEHISPVEKVIVVDNSTAKIRLQTKQKEEFLKFIKTNLIVLETPAILNHSWIKDENWLFCNHMRKSGCPMKTSLYSSQPCKLPNILEKIVKNSTFLRKTLLFLDKLLKLLSNEI